MQLRAVSQSRPFEGLFGVRLEPEIECRRAFAAGDCVEKYQAMTGPCKVIYVTGCMLGYAGGYMFLAAGVFAVLCLKFLKYVFFLVEGKGIATGSRVFVGVMKSPVFRTDSIVTCNSKLLRISRCPQQETGIDFNLPFNVRAGKENTSKPYSISWLYVATGNRLANPQLGEHDRTASQKSMHFQK